VRVRFVNDSKATMWTAPSRRLAAFQNILDLRWLEKEGGLGSCQSPLDRPKAYVIGRERRNSP